jgi:hypothetical protein
VDGPAGPVAPVGPCGPAAPVEPLAPAGEQSRRAGLHARPELGPDVLSPPREARPPALPPPSRQCRGPSHARVTVPATCLPGVWPQPHLLSSLVPSFDPRRDLSLVGSSGSGQLCLGPCDLPCPSQAHARVFGQQDPDRGSGQCGRARNVAGGRGASIAAPHLTMCSSARGVALVRYHKRTLGGTI